MFSWLLGQNTSKPCQFQIYLYIPIPSNTYIHDFAKLAILSWTSWARCGLRLHWACFAKFFLSQWVCLFRLFRLLSLQRFLKELIALPVWPVQGHETRLAKRWEWHGSWWVDSRNQKKQMFAEILRQIYAQKSFVGSSGSSGSVVWPLVTAMMRHGAKSALTGHFDLLKARPRPNNFSRVHQFLQCI